MRGESDDLSLWHFDEVAHAGREHLDADYVAQYDAKSGTDWAEDIDTLLRSDVGKRAQSWTWAWAPGRSGDA